MKVQDGPEDRSEGSSQGRGRGAELLWQIAHAVNLADNVDEAAEYCLKRVAVHDGWSFGHVLEPSDDRPELLEIAGSSYPGDAQRFTELLEVTRGVRLRTDEGIIGRVFETGETVWSNDLSRDLDAARAPVVERLGLKTAAVVPVSVRSEVVAVMEFFADKDITDQHGNRSLLTAVGSYLGRAFERAALLRRLRYVSQGEQERIARELHDAVGQRLAALAMTADAVRARLHAGGSPEANTVGELAEGVRDALRIIRGVVRGLPPVGPGRGELARKLQALTRELSTLEGVNAIAECDTSIDVEDSDVATHLYRIAQEAMHNAIEHADPDKIVVALYRDREGVLHLDVRDDGSGISDLDITSERGIRIMRRRAALIRARLSIGRAEGEGTLVRCRVLHQSGIRG